MSFALKCFGGGWFRDGKGANDGVQLYVLHVGSELEDAGDVEHASIWQLGLLILVTSAWGGGWSFFFRGDFGKAVWWTCDDFFTSGVLLPTYLRLAMYMMYLDLCAVFCCVFRWFMGRRGRAARAGGI